MPLSTGALWPILRPRGTASAADMVSKFEWLEGNRLPMNLGGLSTGMYNIGSNSYKWKVGHFSNNIEIEGYTITANATNNLKVWFNFLRTPLGGGGIDQAGYNLVTYGLVTTGVYETQFSHTFSSNQFAFGFAGPCRCCINASLTAYYSTTSDRIFWNAFSFGSNAFFSFNTSGANYQNVGFCAIE